MFAPLILAIGTVTAIATKITIEIERPDGSIEVINDLVKNTFDQTVEKAKDFANDMNHKKNSSDNNKDYIDLNKSGNMENQIDNEKDVDMRRVTAVLLHGRVCRFCNRRRQRSGGNNPAGNY